MLPLPFFPFVNAIIFLLSFLALFTGKDVVQWADIFHFDIQEQLINGTVHIEAFVDAHLSRKGDASDGSSSLNQPPVRTGLIKLKRDRNEPIAIITKLVVEKQFRHRHAATAIILCMGGYLLMFHKNVVQLNVEMEQGNAHNFYSKLAFQETGMGRGIRFDGKESIILCDKKNAPASSSKYQYVCTYTCMARYNMHYLRGR